MESFKKKRKLPLPFLCLPVLVFDGFATAHRAYALTLSQNSNVCNCLPIDTAGAVLTPPPTLQSSHFFLLPKWRADEKEEESEGEKWKRESEGGWTAVFLHAEGREACGKICDALIAEALPSSLSAPVFHVRF